ncbi:MAG: hypothetical protein O3B95_10075 [Chloroflexi bacterium]|nr:hypothetical protein [Chloroflexota bacterium]
MRQTAGDIKEAADRIFSPLDWFDKWLRRGEMIALAVIVVASWLVGRIVPLPSVTHRFVGGDGVVLSEKTVRSPEWLLSIAIFFLLLFFLAFWALLRNVRTHRSEGKIGISPLPVPFTENSKGQLRLKDRLRRLRTDFTRMDILFVSNNHRPLAESINSVFDAAEWRTNFTNVPLDRYRNELISGIEVKGSSQFLVEQVVAALQEAGVPALKSVIATSEVKLSDTKNLHNQGAVHITVGHH